MYQNRIQRLNNLSESIYHYCINIWHNNHIIFAETSDTIVHLVQNNSNIKENIYFLYVNDKQN